MLTLDYLYISISQGVKAPIKNIITRNSDFHLSFYVYVAFTRGSETKKYKHEPKNLLPFDGDTNPKRANKMWLFVRMCVLSKYSFPKQKENSALGNTT